MACDILPVAIFRNAMAPKDEIFKENDFDKWFWYG